MYRSATTSEWGQLFGLKSTDLTEQQLEKMYFQKLLEFLPLDSRVEKIAGDRLSIVPIKDFTHIKNLSEEELKNKSYFKNKYNDALNIRKIEIEKASDYYYSRNSFVFWSLLDDENKKEEFRRWASGKYSVVDEYNIDYKWLYNNGENELADKTIQNSLNKNDTYRSKERIKNIIEQLPKEEYLKWLPEIFKKDKYAFVLSLTNQDTPEEYTMKALRVASKMTHPPKVNVKISNAMISSLPSITRLEVIEKILYQCRNGKELPFTDINTADELKQFLFSAITRHINRVDAVVRRFTELKNGET